MEKYAIEKILCPSTACVNNGYIHICNICGKMNKEFDSAWVYAHFTTDCIISPYINKENNFARKLGTRYDRLVMGNSMCLICNGIISLPKQAISHARNCIKRLKGDDGGFPPNKLPFNLLDVPTPPAFEGNNTRTCGYCAGKQYKCDKCPRNKGLYNGYIRNYCCLDYVKELLESAFNARLFEKTGYDHEFWCKAKSPPSAPLQDFAYVVYGCCIYCHEELEGDSWQVHMRVCAGYLSRFAEFSKK